MVNKYINIVLIIFTLIVNNIIYYNIINNNLVKWVDKSNIYHFNYIYYSHPNIMVNSDISNNIKNDKKVFKVST